MLQFFDTNLLVYSFDAAAPAKQARARLLLSQGLASGSAVISTQVVQEFLNLACRKFATPLTAAEARLYLDTVLQPLCRHVPSIDFYRRALLHQPRWQLQWYDSLIVTAALDLGATELLSEDFQHGQVFDGLRVRNPFLP